MNWCWGQDSNLSSREAPDLQSGAIVRSATPAKLFNIVYQFKTDLESKMIFPGLKLDIMLVEGKFLIF